MENNKTYELEMLRARISDFAKRSLAGELSVSDFLSDTEAAHAKIMLYEQKILHRAVFFGGYDEAERKILFLLPSYADDLDGSAEEKLKYYFEDERSLSVVALQIQGSGYRELSHRDYLGSVLALGLERDVIGDIVVIDSARAVLFCSGKISEFITASLERVANDAVKITHFDAAESLSANREYKHIAATVASNRLDCVVSALTGLSREKSQELIGRELCQLNHITECRCDRTVNAPCTLSLRGYGKFILRELETKTKKGRIRMSADKYI